MKFLRQLLRAVENDAFIKFLFDHIRNYALCALVFAAAGYEFGRPIGEFSVFFRSLYTAGFNIIGGFLFLANFLHGISKLNQFELPLWLRLFLAFTYPTFIFLILRIAFRT